MTERQAKASTVKRYEEIAILDFKALMASATTEFNRQCGLPAVFWHSDDPGPLGEEGEDGVP